MTVQLNKMAEERDQGLSGGSSEEGEADAQTSEGSQAGGEGLAGAPNAAALPFDIVATAYRRKKLLDALDRDDK